MITISKFKLSIYIFIFGRFFIALIAQAAVQRAALAPHKRNPTFVYIDEAPRFLNLPVSLADALAVSRSLGIGWFLAAQFRSQFPSALRQAVERSTFKCVRSFPIFGAGIGARRVDVYEVLEPKRPFGEVMLPIDVPGAPGPVTVEPIRH